MDTSQAAYPPLRSIASIEFWRASQAGRLRHPRAWEHVRTYAEPVLRDDPEFPLPTKEQWDQMEERLQRMVSEMAQDLVQYWLFEEDGSQYRMIRDLFARRFA